MFRTDSKSFLYTMGSKKFNKLEILKISDLKTTNRDRKNSQQTRCEIIFT